MIEKHDAAIRERKAMYQGQRPGQLSTTRHSRPEEERVPTAPGSSFQERKVRNAGRLSPEAWRIRYMPMA